MKRAIIAAALASLAMSAAVRAADLWTVTASDFSQRDLDLGAITDKVVHGKAGDKSAVELKLDDVVDLTRGGKPDPVSGLVLCTAGGGRLLGAPKAMDNTSITWSAVGIGDVAVPLDQVLGILRSAVADDALLAARDEDEIRLQNGDTIRGTVTAMDDKTVTLTPRTGDATALSADVIARVLLAVPVAGRPPAAEPAFVVRLAGGTVLPCAALAIDNKGVRLTPVGGAECKLKPQQITQIDHTGGRVRWLDARTPASAIETPFFEGSFPHRIGRSVDGLPLRVSGKAFDHGVGVHSASNLTYPVMAGDTTFRTRYGVQDNLPYADVDVRIKLDGKVVHEATGLRSGVLSPVIEIDLRGGKTITLEVDYGKGYDVQDHLDWIEPAFVRASQS